MPEEGINPVEFPPIMWDLWQWFKRLDRSRENGINGRSPLSEQSIGWFFRNRKITPQSWQLDTLAMLDTIALSNPDGAK